MSSISVAQNPVAYLHNAPLYDYKKTIFIVRYIGVGGLGGSVGGLGGLVGSLDHLPVIAIKVGT